MIIDDIDKTIQKIDNYLDDIQYINKKDITEIKNVILKLKSNVINWKHTSKFPRKNEPLLICNCDGGLDVGLYNGEKFVDYNDKEIYCPEYYIYETELKKPI